MIKLIENVNIISADTIIYDKSVLVEDDKIKDIVDRKNLLDRKNIKIIDGKGRFLAPGFIDIHNHGNSGYDIMDANKEAYDSMSDFHLSQGVTSYLGTVITSSYDNMLNACREIGLYKSKKNSSELLGIHLEGPFFSVSKKGAQPEKYIKNPDINYIKEVIDISKGKLKMLSIAPELEGAMEVISYLEEHNIIVALAHTNASYEEARDAFNHGATVATHLYNAMSGFNHREPGVVGACLIDDRAYTELIYDRVHLHDAAAKLAIKSKGIDKIILISDAMRATGLKDGNYELGGQEVIVKEGQARLLSGNLAGSVLTLKKAVQNAYRYLDLSLVDAIKMASIIPARAIGIESRKGSIEIGKDADFIFIDEDINIYNVMVRGEMVCLEN